MTNWTRIVIYSLLVFFVLLIIQDTVDAKRGNKVEKIKDRALREEKRQIKKEGKKIKKSFSKKYEQIFLSMCPDCYARLLSASESCSSHYEKLNLPKDKVEKCKEKSNERSKKKKRKHLDNSIEDNVDSLKGYKDIYNKEVKMLDCLFDQLKEQEKYKSLSKDEFKKERNQLSQQLLQEKTDCIKKQLQSNLPETNRTITK